MEEGICPDIVFPSKDSICSCWNFPKKVEMMPVNRLSSVTLVSAAASKAWPLTEVEGCIPGAKDGHVINHNFSFGGKQGQPIHFISS
ncbi:hypothetical protein FF1_001492 [Malus domestica]